MLIEPNYKNKYPPIGLMKISTYYKAKEDYVEFHKGLMPKEYVKTFDKALITTLFTFDFDLCIQTIKYYIAILGVQNVYVGGIAATIMPNRFKQEIPGVQIVVRQLVSSNLLGYDDNQNIDSMELDYDILLDIPYKYPMENSYFIYTSRGCPRKCSFCAVKDLEPDFYECTGIEMQIKKVDRKFGKKKIVLVMDNNVLYSDIFPKTVNKFIQLGFGRENNTIKKVNDVKYYLRSLQDRVKYNKPYHFLLMRIKDEFSRIVFSRVSKQNFSKMSGIVSSINDFNDEARLAEFLIDHSDYLIRFYDKYNYHKIKRYIDFNQGLDARLLSDKAALELSKLALRPCRIAFDDIALKGTYLKALNNAVACGITHFSNYILYNYNNDSPQDLWERLYLNVRFVRQHTKMKIQLFSFPMKYAAINQVDRNFVGKYWNKKFLRAVNIILNVTSGIVPKEEPLFFRAFGKNPEEFLEILYMPDDFIRHRNYFDDKGLIGKWRKIFHKLSLSEKGLLLEVFEGINNNSDYIDDNKTANIDEILPFYRMKRLKSERT